MVNADILLSQHCTAVYKLCSIALVSWGEMTEIMLCGQMGDKAPQSSSCYFWGGFPQPTHTCALMNQEGL